MEANAGEGGLKSGEELAKRVDDMKKKSKNNAEEENSLES
jgi:hypothetical protein